MRHHNLPIQLCIISRGRPENVRALEKLCNQEFTWFVPFSEVEDYERAGAKGRVEGGHPGLCERRNGIMLWAWAKNGGDFCLQMSDDLRKIESVVQFQKHKQIAEIAFETAVQLCYRRLATSPFMHAGVAPTPNAFYYSGQPVGYRHFILADFMMTKPCDTWFTNEMLLKEDYDYTCQHLEKFGGVVRCNDLLLTFPHKSKSGGVTGVRTLELERKMAAKLVGRWPQFINPHPKRDGEVLLKA